MNGRILIVTEDDQLQKVFQETLKDDRYSITMAQRCDEGVRALSKIACDLVFVDLPGDDSPDSMDFLREIQKQGWLCVVIIITDYPTITTAFEALRLGAYDYIPKPIRSETLLRIVNMALRHKALLDEKEGYRADLDALFSSVKDSVIVVDQDLIVREINASARNMCGFPEDLLGRSFDGLSIGCQGVCIQMLQKTIKQGRSFKRDRVSCDLPEHPSQIVSLSTSPLHGKRLGAVIILRDETRLDHLERDLKERTRFHNLVGQSHSMQNVYTLIEAVADTPSTVLITGESGTGKELAAAALHYQSERHSKPFVTVNCAAMPDTLLESELFGHVKGAFTGAIQNKAGRFQRADGGTILLDEIGDISPRMQQGLLRVLQDGTFERVGDATSIKVDVRVVAATNRDLSCRIQEGKFREDLYYRLKVITLKLPSLRERKEDIPLLVQHLLERLNQKLDRRVSSVDAVVQDLFMHYNWPGNVRELEHVLEYSVILCHTNRITRDHLPEEFKEISNTTSDTTKIVHSSLQLSQNNERERIRQMLKQTGWNKAKAARQLSISRQTLYRKIQRYGIELT